MNRRYPLISAIRPLHNRERGAIAILLAVVLSLVVLCMVFALDTGRLYLERQEVQRIADLAALDAAAGSELFNGTNVSDQLQELAVESANRNGFSLDDPDRTVVASQGAVRVGGNEEPNNQCSQTDINTRRFLSSPPPSLVRDAVKVVVTHNVPTSLVANLAALIPGTDILPTTTLTGCAVAQRTLNVAFSAGTTLLSVDTNASPLLKALLGSMLGTNVNLSLVGYQGLAKTGISLRDLATELGLNVLSVEGLLSAQVSVKDLAQAAIDVLDSRSGDTFSSEIIALNNLIFDGSASLGNILTLGDILDVYVPDDQSEEGVLSTQVSVGQLLNTAVFLANKNSGVEISDLTLNVGQLVNIAKLNLSIIQPPQIAIGPVGCKNGAVPPCTQGRTEAQPAQVELQITGLGIKVGNLANLKLNLTVKAVGGRAWVESAESLSASQYNLSVRAVPIPLEVDVTACLSLLNINLGFTTAGNQCGKPNNPSDSNHISSSGLLDSQSIIWSPPPSTPFTTTFYGSPGNVIDSVGGLLDGLNLEVKCTANALTCLLSGVLDLLTDITQGLVDTLETLLGGAGPSQPGPLDALLTPLLNALGVGINTIDVEILDVQAGAVELVI